MKLAGANEQVILFQVSRRERNALIQLLRTYPLVPPAHQAVTRKSDDPKAAEQQRLLDEALAEQRAANLRRIETWVMTPGRFQERPSGFHLLLDRTDTEWLLQVLNDIRVGNWLRLGAPDLEQLKLQDFVPNSLPHWMAMEMCSHLQMSILRALEKG